MKNNDKYVEAKKYLQKRYPKELSDKRWNTSDINDDWVTEMMTDFASQSKPQEIKPVDTKTVDAVDTTFWRRLEMLVSNIQVNDMAGEEEKQYIIHVIESKK